MPKAHLHTLVQELKPLISSLKKLKIVFAQVPKAIRYFFLDYGHKKSRGTCRLLKYEVLDYLTYQIRKAHDVTRERFQLFSDRFLYEIV
jgi:hypothetical protein